MDAKLLKVSLHPPFVSKFLDVLVDVLMTDQSPVYTLNYLFLYRYFGGCPLVNIPEMAHPVKVYNLDDLPQLMGWFVAPTSIPTNESSLFEEDVDVDLTISVIVWVSQIFAEGDGAILCFLPVSQRTTSNIFELGCEG